MSRELIRPVVSTIEPILTNITTTFGRRTKFPTPEELGIKIDIHPLPLPSGVMVNLRETDPNTETHLHLSIFSHLGNIDFARVTQSSNVGGKTSFRILEDYHLVRALSVTCKGYGAEDLEKLHLVEGGQIDFLVGLKTDSVFVDGWTKEARSPRWRLLLPREGESKILIPSSRLLLFAQD